MYRWKTNAQTCLCQTLLLKAHECTCMCDQTIKYLDERSLLRFSCVGRKGENGVPEPWQEMRRTRGKGGGYRHIPSTLYSTQHSG